MGMEAAMESAIAAVRAKMIGLKKAQRPQRAQDYIRAPCQRQEEDGNWIDKGKKMPIIHCFLQSFVLKACCFLSCHTQPFIVFLHQTNCVCLIFQMLGPIKSVFSAAQEAKLVTHILSMEALFFGLTTLPSMQQRETIWTTILTKRGEILSQHFFLISCQFTS